MIFDMHAALLQHLFKFNMLHSMKSQARFYSTKRATKSGPKNHYDTLKITPHATQNEVKSAYYKLTLQYHPDKNKSEYAKQKFQDIAEAYGVLSNHEQRKTYDRGMLLHRQPASTTTQETPISYYKDKVYSGSSKIYNFDAWIEAHYGKQMHAARVRRQQYENYKKEKEEALSRKNPQYMEVAVILFTITLIAMLFREKTDVVKRKIEG